MLCLLLGSGGAPVFAQAPNITYSGPLVITQGGTYTGNYRSTNSAVPVISIQTSQPVILDNCTLAGAGDLIDGKPSQANLTVRNCRGYGLTPSADNTRRGYFLAVNGARSVRVEHNYLEQTMGINVHQWSGDGSAGQTLTIRYNRVKNIDSRYRNGGGTYTNFVGMDKVANLANLEIAWNEVINEPNNSLVEDNINFYNSGGTAQSWVRVHDNYIQGAFPFPATEKSFYGTGMIIDGTDTNTQGYVEVSNNQIVSACNSAMNIAAGHDIYYHENRLVTAAVLPNGTRLPSAYTGIAIFNSAQASSFGNVRVDNNTIGYVQWGRSNPFQDRQDEGDYGLKIITNTQHLPNPITVQTEQQEFALWQQKLKQNGITLDASGTGTTTPPTTTPPTTTPPTTTPPVGTPANAAFFRGLNLGGGTATIDGRLWEDGGSAANFSINGAPFANQNVALNPATDAARATMIRSSVYSAGIDAAIGGAASGTYSVYLYVWEDNDAQTYSITLEGKTVQASYNSGAAGHWDRLGPFTAAVSDGTINVGTTGGDANISGIEIWKQNAAPAAATPTVSLSAPGTGTVGTPLALGATAASAGGSIAKVEFFAGTTKLGEDLTAPYALSYVPTAAGSLALTARATDAAGAATTSAPVTVTVAGAPVNNTPTFVRAINLGGAATTLDGHAWAAGSSAPNFQATGVTTFANQGVALNPATGADRATMIRSSMYGTGTSLAIGGVASGTYSVYLYVWEDNSPETFSITLEGKTVQANYNSGAAGHWDRLGPFTATVSDGTINVGTTGGAANLSGLEIWKLPSSPL